MHGWLLGLSLLLAASAAPHRTEVIDMRYVDAAELGQVWLRGESGGLIPDGIAAWTIEPRRNAFRVVGTEAGIEAFKQALRSLDVAPRQVSVLIEAVPWDAGQRRALRVQGVQLETPAATGVGLLTAAQRRELRRRGTLASVMITTPEGQAAQLRSDRAPHPVFKELAVTARPNADGTVTALIGSLRSPRVNGRPGETESPGDVVVRRVQSGQPFLLVPAGETVALVIQVTVLAQAIEVAQPVDSEPIPPHDARP